MSNRGLPHGVAEQAGSCNRTILDIGFQPRLHPNCLRSTWHDFDGLEPLPHLSALLHAPTGADLANIGELAAFLPRQMEGRHEPVAFGRVANDGESLSLYALHLDPILGATRSVGRVHALRDHTLKAHLAGVLEHLRTVVLHVIGEEDWSSDAAEKLLEDAPMIDRRCRSQVEAV